MFLVYRLKPAPAFKATAVQNGEFKEMSLADFKGKYLVLFFYPLDFTFVCPTEIISFSDKANEFHDVNCEVVGVSVDSHFTHLAWINTPRKTGGLGHIHIPLLSDLTKQISRDYGVLLEGPGIYLKVREPIASLTVSCVAAGLIFPYFWLLLNFVCQLSVHIQYGGNFTKHNNFSENMKRQNTSQ
uniref:Thioredoxin-dependent peroxide reductase, mitochondrial n=1 Tax=Lates calcarifer TaxID=8187 RepID=A0A4W6EZ80_LATCA